jgi:hypothetical protein
MVFSERRKTLASSVGGCYSYSRGVQTERLLREQKHNFGACLSRQRYLPTNPKKTRVQNWTDLGSNLPIPFMAISPFWLRGLCLGVARSRSLSELRPSSTEPWSPWQVRSLGGLLLGAGAAGRPRP